MSGLGHGTGPALDRELPRASLVRTVLVVDDEMLIRWAIAESLRSSGIDVIEAGNAGEALDRLAGHAGSVAVALLDLRLPDSTDFGLMQQIRVMDPACKVIVLTADGTPGILDAAVRAGAFHALSKPFDIRALASLIRQAASA